MLIFCLSTKWSNQDCSILFPEALIELSSEAAYSSAAAALLIVLLANLIGDPLFFALDLPIFVCTKSFSSLLGGCLNISSNTLLVASWILFESSYFFILRGELRIISKALKYVFLWRLLNGIACFLTVVIELFRLRIVSSVAFLDSRISKCCWYTALRFKF